MLDKIDIKVIRNNRKRMAIKISKINNEVVVYAPLRQSDKSINHFIQANHDWIVNTRKAIAEKIIDKPQKFLYFGKEYEFEVSNQFKSNLTLIDKMYVKPGIKDFEYEINKFYFKMGAEIVIAKIKEFADELGVTFSKVSFRNVRSRWGSCSMRKNISINIKLIKTPHHIIDYVLIHELCHLKEMNHSPEFWALVAKADPNYKEHRKWLKENGGYLLAAYTYPKSVQEPIPNLFG